MSQGPKCQRQFVRRREPASADRRPREQPRRLLWPSLQGARDHKETLETDSTCRPLFALRQHAAVERAGPGGYRPGPLGSARRWERIRVTLPLRRSVRSALKPNRPEVLLLTLMYEWRDLWRIADIRRLSCFAILRQCFGDRKHPDEAHESGNRNEEVGWVRDKTERREFSR